MSHSSVVETTEEAASTTTTTHRNEKTPNINHNKNKSSSSVSSSTKKMSIPNTASSFLSLSPISSLTALAPKEDASAEKRRKAAAAARRRRRKITLSRRQHNSPRSVQSQSRVFNGPSLAGLSSSANTLAKLEEGNPEDCAPSSSSSSTTTKRIRSTVDGMLEVANRWQRQEIVAVPTECTYEACISLQTTSASPRGTRDEYQQPFQNVTPPDWAYRIERLRQIAGSCDLTTASSASASAPYLWVSRTADCAVLKQCFPVRLYALRDSKGGLGTAPLAHRFNENLEVIQRLSRQVWPGPITMNVAVSLAQTKATSSSGTSQQYLRSFLPVLASVRPPSEVPGSSSVSSMATCPYVTLRCPRHPLAVKASQKHVSLMSEAESSDIQAAASVSTKKSKAMSVLVGFPIALEHDTHDSSPKIQYCKASKDVESKYSKGPEQVFSSSTVSAVLDGEDQSELFAVPTCEYGTPWHTQLWIHGPSRTITVVKKDSASTLSTIDPGCSGVAVSSPIAKGTTPDTVDVSPTRIKAALRQRLPNRPQLSKTKERIIQAVLCRWTIVEKNVE